jgi:predicted O-linked N-acetylglucosamine transferase (SPINDLY family)
MTVQEAREFAGTHAKAGRIAEAEAIYREILSQIPDDPETLNSLGILYSQTGQNEAALQLLGRAVARQPASAAFLCNAGLILARLDRLDEAIAHYRRALELSPTEPQLLNNMGWALGRKGDLNGAIDCFNRALLAAPDSMDIRYNLAQAQSAAGQVVQAVETLGRVLQARPDLARVWDDLGTALRTVDRLDESILAYQEATGRKPTEPAYHFHLGNALQQRGYVDQAIASFGKATELESSNADYRNNLGQAYYFKGAWDDALHCFRQAAELNPALAIPQNNIANVLKDFARLDEAMPFYQKALQLDPNHAPHHSNYVYALHFNPLFDGPKILRELREYNDRHAAPVKQFIRPHTNDCDPNRRLRIGYVSPDFREHVVGKNLLPLFQHHDHSNYEIFCYSRVPYPDWMTEKFRAAADHWRFIRSASDEQAAEMIRNDRIDILIDLALHLAGNRLPVFARKPAPVQATFGGYPGGTGLEAMDYRLTDPFLDPPGEMDNHHAETPIRLPDSFWCYDPGAMGVAEGSEVNPLPALQNGFITFCCLNNFAKINDLVLALWSEVLTAIPTSRLLLLTPAGETRRQIAARFADFGVVTARLQLVNRENPAGYFRLYHQVDIGLDTLPYNGHTTSLDSLWMGVPVITLIGKTVVGRAGWSQLCNLKLRDLAAKSPDDFVQMAIDLANDLPRLAALRAGLRQRMLESPLTDAVKFTRGIEAAYRQMWRIWCGSVGNATEGLSR